MRNEGRESVEAHRHRKRRVEKVDVRERVFAGEDRAIETAQPRCIVGTKALPAFIGWQNPGLQYFGYRLSVSGFRPDRGKRIRRREALVGTIEYLPVAQLTAPPEPDAACRDPAQGKGDHFQSCVTENARIGDSRWRVLLWRFHRSRRRFTQRCPAIRMRSCRSECSGGPF